jgi:hypothetical protein
VLKEGKGKAVEPDLRKDKDDDGDTLIREVLKV